MISDIPARDGKIGNLCYSAPPLCNKNLIYVFPEKELHCLSPNFHISTRIGPHIFLQQNRQSDCGNICINRSQTHECGNWDSLRPRNSFSGNICLKFSVLCLCSAVALDIFKDGREVKGLAFLVRIYNFFGRNVFLFFCSNSLSRASK